MMKTRAVILGGAGFALPTTDLLFAADNKPASNPSDYSDRDRMRSSGDEKKQLEQALKTGEEKAFYRRELEKMGWQITAVNYDKPDYVEYEIVKGPSTYEVQLNFDKNSHKANKVDVTWNIWKADATEKALKSEKARLEQALKTGEEKDFYRRELEKMGWQITSVNYDKPDYVEYEIVKGQSTYEVQLDFGKNSLKANKVNVAYNLWKAEATNKALKQNQEHARR